MIFSPSRQEKAPGNTTTKGGAKGHFWECILVVQSGIATQVLFHFGCTISISITFLCRAPRPRKLYLADSLQTRDKGVRQCCYRDRTPCECCRKRNEYGFPPWFDNFLFLSLLIISWSVRSLFRQYCFLWLEGGLPTCSENSAFNFFRVFLFF